MAEDPVRSPRRCPFRMSDFLRISLIQDTIIIMKKGTDTLHERLRNARKYLGLFQEFVAIQMGISRPAMCAIECGEREVTPEELERFSRSYCVSPEELLYGKEEDPETEIFAEGFPELCDHDKREILNLLEFKREYLEHRNAYPSAEHVPETD